MSIGNAAFQSVQMAPMPSPNVISIASGPFSARIRPAWGGRMTHLTHAQFGDILVPTETEVFDPWNWPKAGAYPLFPYHNRLYGASFMYGGVTYNVLPNPVVGKDATHGPAHRRPWCIVSQTSDRAVLSLVYDADAEWPFAFEARQSFTLSSNGLTVELTLINKAEVPAPAAIGWHPYFAAGLDCKAQTDAALAYPLDDHDLPTGEPPVARSTMVLPALAGYTKHFVQWSNAKIILKDSQSLVIEADPVLSHLAAHRTERYICLEPVSMAAGTLHQPETQRGDLGLKILAPGESLVGSIGLSL